MRTLERGFTFIELLLYMGLMSLFIVVLGNILISVLDIQTSSESTSIVEVDGRFLLSRLMYDIHRAEDIINPAGLGQTTGVLELQMNSGNVSYSLNGSVLELTASGITDQLTSVGSQMTNFSVTRLGNLTGKNSLQIQFTLTSQNESQDYLITVGIR